MKMSIEHPPHHIPVLLQTALEQLKPHAGETYLDLTAGYGGHAREFLKRTGTYLGSTLVDRDSFSIENLQEFREQGVQILHSDFYAAARLLIEQGRSFDIVLIDLGVSSPQLDQGIRGFSFSHDGPLDMRMDRRQSLTAETVVNDWSRDELVHILCRYGEETYAVATRVVDAIIAQRPFYDTKTLAEVIKQTMPWAKTKRIHPATRTFQAIRIAVNHELEQIEKTLPLLPQLLRSGGRVGIISFHSLEDRLVKQYFADQKSAGYEAELDILTKKPLSGDIYDVHNPRSRSAKLRVAVKK